MKTGYHNLHARFFQQIFRQRSQKRIDNTLPMMQSDNNVRYVMLFCRMKNTGRNIHVKTHYGLRLYIRFCHYLGGPFQSMFPLKFLFQ